MLFQGNPPSCDLSRSGNRPIDASITSTFIATASKVSWLAWNSAKVILAT